MDDSFLMNDTSDSMKVWIEQFIGPLFYVSVIDENVIYNTFQTDILFQIRNE